MITVTTEEIEVKEDKTFKKGWADSIDVKVSTTKLQKTRDTFFGESLMYSHALLVLSGA